MPLQALADAIQDPRASTYIRDADGQVIYANDVFYTALNKPRHAVLGKTIAELMGSQGEAGSWQSVDSLVFASGTPVITEQHYNGQTFVVLKMMVTGHDGRSYLLASGVPANTPEEIIVEKRIAALEQKLLNFISNENAEKFSKNIPSNAFNRMSTVEQEPYVAAIDRLTSRTRDMFNEISLQSVRSERQVATTFKLAAVGVSLIVFDTAVTVVYLFTH